MPATLFSIPDEKLKKSARAFLKRHNLERHKALFYEWREDPVGAVLHAITCVPDSQRRILACYWRRCQRRALEWGGENFTGKAP